MGQKVHGGDIEVSVTEHPLPVLNAVLPPFHENCQSATASCVTDGALAQGVRFPPVLGKLPLRIPSDRTQAAMRSPVFL